MSLAMSATDLSSSLSYNTTDGFLYSYDPLVLASNVITSSMQCKSIGSNLQYIDIANSVNNSLSVNKSGVSCTLLSITTTFTTTPLTIKNVYLQP